MYEEWVCTMWYIHFGLSIHKHGATLLSTTVVF